MTITQFVNNLNSLNVINTVGLNPNSNMNQTFLDFLYLVLESLQKQGCTSELLAGTTGRPEYKNGNAIFITYKQNTDTCYNNLYSAINNLKKTYPNASFETKGNSVLVFLQQSETEQKKETEDKKNSTPEKINWEQFPCVTADTKNKKFTENNQIVYSGSGFVWYGNGSRKEISTGKIGYYECGTDGKPKSVTSMPIIQTSQQDSNKDEIDHYSFLDSSLGELTKGLDAQKLTQDFVSSFGDQKESVNNEFSKKKKLFEQINKINKIIKWQ
jgi:hypothetical protein